MSRQRLGRGLQALMPAVGGRSEGPEIREVPVTAIVPNRYQPRMDVEERNIEELAASIRQHGVLEPIIVRPMGKGYELVVGERRWRAATAAGLSHIPALVREMTDREAMAVALIENLQREQLDPIEEAMGYKRLMEMFEVTQEEVAREVGRPRSSVANSLRLLSLEPAIQDMLRDGRLSAGHGKVLLAVPGGEGRVALAKEVAAKGLSVRDTEVLVKAGTKKPVKKPRKAEKPKDPALREVEGRLEAALGTRVRVSRRSAGGGRIEIDYYGDDDLVRIMEALGVDDRSSW